MILNSARSTTRDLEIIILHSISTGYWHFILNANFYTKTSLNRRNSEEKPRVLVSHSGSSGYISEKIAHVVYPRKISVGAHGDGIGNDVEHLPPLPRNAMARKSRGERVRGSSPW